MRHADRTVGVMSGTTDASVPQPMSDGEHALVSSPAGFDEARVLAQPPPEHRRSVPLPTRLQPTSVAAVEALFSRCVPTAELDAQLSQTLRLPVPKGLDR